MESDPMAFFGMLLNACIRDEWRKESLLTATAISFALGIVTSGLTAYVLTAAHAFI
jgi:hypothetical protein